MLQNITQSQLLPILLAVAAFLVAALLILYIFRLLFGRRIRAPGARNRPRRLDVVDAFDLDRERQLVIVRRDNIEHLLLIGGPNDLLVEGAINRGEASVAQLEPREARPAAPTPGWPPAPPAETAAMAPPLRDTPQPAAAPFSLDSLKRRPPEPSRLQEPVRPTEAPRTQEPPKAPPLAPSLPSDLFAPAPHPARSQPAAPENAPPASAPAPTPSLSSAPRMGGPIFTPRPTAPRPPTPPFLSRTQRVVPPLKKDPPPAPSPEPAGITVEPPKQEVEPAEPKEENRPEAPQHESTPAPPEPTAEKPQDSPPAAAPATESSDALESLEAEMARLLGRPGP